MISCRPQESKFVRDSLVGMYERDILNDEIIRHMYVPKNLNSLCCGVPYKRRDK
jgi:hypothetical protein